MHFFKYEGLGNDFIILDSMRGPLVTLKPKEVLRLCDRHLGIGADGVLELQPSKSSNEVAFMKIINSDGTRAAMCGNGLRAVALHLFRQGIIFEKTNYLLGTDSGPIDFILNNRNCDFSMPVIAYGPWHSRKSPLQQLSKDYGPAMHINMGNPHLVFWEPVWAKDFSRVAKEISQGAEDGINVSAVQNIGFHEIRVRVYERGAGETKACGTAAMATVAAGIYNKQIKKGNWMRVVLPGGTVKIRGKMVELDNGLNNRLLMELSGEANFVFEGKYSLQKS